MLAWPESAEFVGRARTVKQADPLDLSMKPDEAGTVKTRLKPVIGLSNRA